MSVTIKAIGCDLGAAYFRKDKPGLTAELQQIETRAGIQPGTAIGMLKHNLMSQYKDGSLATDEFWTKLKEELKFETDIPNKELIAAYHSEYVPDEAMVPLIKHLRNGGVQTFAVSNTIPCRVKTLQEKYGYENDFDGTVYSFNEKSLKPDEAMFRAFLAAAKCNPNEAFFIDDDAGNVRAAQALGIHGHVCDGNVRELIRQMGLVGINCLGDFQHE